MAGPPGPRGFKGEVGRDGARGEKGVAGAPGSRGSKGETGASTVQRNWKQCAWKKQDGRDIGLLKVSLVFIKGLGNKQHEKVSQIGGTELFESSRHRLVSSFLYIKNSILAYITPRYCLLLQSVPSERALRIELQKLQSALMEITIVFHVVSVVEGLPVY